MASGIIEHRGGIMLKGGIYIDAENVMRTGGWGMRYDILREYVEAQGITIVRANAYMGYDPDKEREDYEVAAKKADYRTNLRRAGFKLVLKRIRRFQTSDGEAVCKANTDVEMIVDALVQGKNLDYVLLLTGDGDFVKVVTALQNYGSRVEVVGFRSFSHDLRAAADAYRSGYLIPGLLPTEDGRVRGYVHQINEAKYYGFATVPRGLRDGEEETDIFIHGNDVEAGTLSNSEFSALKRDERVIEFDLVTDEQDRARALNVHRIA